MSASKPGPGKGLPRPRSEVAAVVEAERNAKGRCRSLRRLVKDGTITTVEAIEYLASTGVNTRPRVLAWLERRLAKGQ